jgi:predicted RNase H-like nuclease (RuvC/YqgF family)
MEEVTLYTIVASVVTMVFGFLIGKSGVLTKVMDIKIRRMEDSLNQDNDQIHTLVGENKKLKEELLILERKVIVLEAKIKEYDRNMKLLMEYMKKFKLDDQFIDKLTNIDK